MMLAPKPNIISVPSTWTKNSVRINVTLPSGVTASIVQRQVSLDDMQTWKNWTANTIVSENQTVYARYVFKSDVTVNEIDYKIGDVSDVAVCKIASIDKILPIIDILPKEDDIKIINGETSASSITVNVKDDNSGVKSFTYSKDEGEEIVVDDNTVTLSDRGIYIFTVTDNATNQTVARLTLLEKPKIITEPYLENGGIYDFDVILSSNSNVKALKVNGEVVEIPYTLNVIQGEERKYFIEVEDIYGATDSLKFALFIAVENDMVQFYKKEYLNDRPAKINAGLSFYLLKAQKEIERFINNLLNMEDYNSKMCICEIADYIFTQEKIANKTSESVDGYSVSWDITNNK